MAKYPQETFAGEFNYITYLGGIIAEEYKGKQKTLKDFTALFMAAMCKKPWTEPLEAYPNWLEEKQRKAKAEEKARLRNTPPQSFCPLCGAEAKLDSWMRCPQCGGFYQFNEETGKQEFHESFKVEPGEWMKKLEALVKANRASSSQS